MGSEDTMCRRMIIVALVALAVLLLAHFATDRYTAEPPNYTRIEDGLWLGGFVTKPPPGVSAVLNLCETRDPYLAATHRWEPIRDAEPAPSLEWLRTQVAFIESHRQARGAVYVHCQNGASRSGMVVVAYLMKRDGRSRDDAIAFVRSQRSALRPNPAFMQLLAEWERSLQACIERTHCFIPQEPMHARHECRHCASLV
jgi:hypothetical protein